MCPAVNASMEMQTETADGRWEMGDEDGDGDVAADTYTVRSVAAVAAT